MASGAELTPRAREIVTAARELLEEEGPEALSMRRLGERLGIRAPSIYKHLPGKDALEAAVISDGFEELAATLDGTTLEELARGYRAFAREHPHLYRLMTARPARPRAARAGCRGPRRVARRSRRPAGTATPRGPCGPSPTG